MKKCFAQVEYRDGKRNLIEFSLQGNLPFSLKEAEEWIMEDPKVKKVKCFTNIKAIKSKGE